MDDDLVEIGRVAGPRGLKGRMWIIPYGDTFEGFEPYTHIIITTQGKPIKVLSSRKHSGRIELSLEDITDASQVEEIKGKSVYVHKKQLKEPGPGEYYWHDLLGMTVRDTQGKILGEVVRIFSTGSNDVIVVDPEKQLYLPFTKDVVVDISLEDRTLTVDASLIEELLD